MTVILDTNVVGLVRTTHAFLPLLERSANPVIVNVGSSLGSLGRVTSPGLPEGHIPTMAYGASKAAVTMITMHYARAFPNIRVNCVDPGYTATDLNGHSGYQSAAEGAAIIARMARSSMLEVLGLDYLRTARAKGLAEQSVIVRHALKNALIPVVTIIGLQFGGLLSGAFLTETVFARPGVGRYIVTAIGARDYPVIQATVLVVAVLFVLINLMVDIIYAFLDPRIHFG